MDIYKEAIRKPNLRFQTSQGMLTLYQLFTTDTVVLEQAAIELDKVLEVGKTSYIKKRSPVNATIKLQRDILVDVIETLEAEKEEALNAKEIKEWNEEIYADMRAAERKERQNMSKEELAKLLKKA